MTDSVWSSPLVEYNKKKNRRVVVETRPDHAIRNSIAIQITARPCHPEEEEEEEKQQKGEMPFFENVFYLD